MAPARRRFRVRPQCVELDTRFTPSSSSPNCLRVPSAARSISAICERCAFEDASKSKNQRPISARSSCGECGAGGCADATTVSAESGNKERSNDS